MEKYEFIYNAIKFQKQIKYFNINVLSINRTILKKIFKYNMFISPKYIDY